jgi:predicted AAA+ superfamily ATPase
MNNFSRFFPRDAEQKIEKWLNQNYIVALLGARQVGKTTLLRKIAREQKIPCFYYSFDDILLKNKVSSDFYFLKKDLEAKLGVSLKKLAHKIFLLIDEAQKEPAVFEFLKILHDNFPSQIKILVSGSASLEIQKKTSESLAGRAQYVYLYPLSLGEVFKERFRLSKKSLFEVLFKEKLSFDFLRKQQSFLYPYLDQLENLLKQILIFGLLPGTWQRTDEEKMGYLRSVVMLYLEKDIRMAGLVKELENFQALLEILSFQVGGILNLNRLSSSVQVSVNTLRHYRSILKNTFVLNSVYPYIQSPQKRVVKSPKVYFYDIGVANYLAGRERIENVLDSKASGGIFENIIIKSFEAFSKNEVLSAKIAFFRDYQGREVDLVLRKTGRSIPVEITNSGNIINKKILNLSHFLTVNKQANFGLIIYKGELKIIKVFHKPIFCLPWWLWW